MGGGRRRHRVATPPGPLRLRRVSARRKHGADAGRSTATHARDIAREGCAGRGSGHDRSYPRLRSRSRNVLKPRVAAADARLKLYETLWAPPVKRVLERIRFVRRIYNGWERRHPFDVAHGLDTSGYLPAAQCAPGDAAMASEITCYGGSQPSIVRAVLARLPVREQYAFVDLGCGKGRPLAVASEFPFRRIVGIEIAPELAAVARSNAAILASRHPDRRPIEIEI